MGFSERRRLLVDAGFETFGEPAEYIDVTAGTKLPVVIRRRDRDEEDRFGNVSIKSRSINFRIRSWQVRDPKPGDMIEVPSGDLAGLYEVRPDPMLDAKGVWDCPVERRAQ